MDSGMRNFTSRLTTIHFPDSLAMARMGPIKVHVHQRRVSNCTGWWHPSKQLGRQSLERPSRLCACTNEKGTAGGLWGMEREQKWVENCDWYNAVGWWGLFPEPVAARQGDRLTLATRTQHESQFMPDPQGNKATRFDNSSDAPLNGQYP